MDLLRIWLKARFADADRGASLIEYALLAVLIAVVCMLAIAAIGNTTSESFSSSGSAFG